MSTQGQLQAQASQLNPGTPQGSTPTGISNYNAGYAHQAGGQPSTPTQQVCSSSYFINLVVNYD